jgi:predicted glycosyltransferase
MNILFDIAHPAHVHVVRNAYLELTKRGHKVYVTVKDIPSAIALLEKYEIPYTYLGGKKDNLAGKIILQLMYNVKVWWLVMTKKIDLAFSSSITPPYISRLSRMHSIIFDDDDDAVEPLFVKYGHPFSDVVLSPACAVRATDKFIPYSGYHELAYLHPNWFTPDVAILREIGLKPGETYFVLRFNAFKAHHDVGVKGLSIENKRTLIAFLEKRGKVFITTERNIDEEFKKYQLLLSPEKVHSLIYYATMLIGDSQTMTSEAAVLGTPAIRSNTFVGQISYLEEEEHTYGLTYGFLPNDFEALHLKIEELLAMPNLKEIWQKRREKMLEDKIDVTAFYVWFIENYPESANTMRKNPEYQYNFK